MSRIDPARLDITNYASDPMRMQVRFQDLDPLQHLNNVAITALFETSRLKFNQPATQHLLEAGAGGRWVIARLDINFTAEGGFADVDIVHAVGHIGSSSWTVLSGAFQDGKCIATCDAVLVNTDGFKPVPLNDAARAVFEKLHSAAF